MEKFNILLVDDEIIYFEMLEEMSEPGFHFHFAQNKEEMRIVLEKENINLILMDWNVGDEDGLDIVRSIKRHFGVFNIPILMLTGKSGDQNVVTALDSGIDDYITKPFSQKLLMAKVKANLRKTETRLISQKMNDTVNVMFDDNKMSVNIHDQELILRKKEYLILKFLFSNPDRCFTRGELNQLTSGRDVYISDRCVDTYVRYLRTKLKDHLEIKTVRGKGYRAILK